MTAKSRAGVTLLELLIAVSLLAVLATGALMALRLGVSAMGKANTMMMDNRRIAGAQQILERQIAGFMPVIAECLPAGEAPPERLPFFQGDPQSMRFVSSYSLGEAWRGYAQTLEYLVIPGEGGEGVRLVVNEHLYTGPRGPGRFCLGTVFDSLLVARVPRFLPIQTGPQSFVLADRLAFCRFSYREELPPPQRELWTPRWTKPEWPTAVRIEMAPLAPDPTRLQPVTLTAPVRVNTIPGRTYAQ